MSLVHSTLKNSNNLAKMKKNHVQKLTSVKSIYGQLIRNSEFANKQKKVSQTKTLIWKIRIGLVGSK